MREDAVVKQLTGLDATFLYMETPYSYGHVSSVSIYARPEPGYDAYNALRSTIEERLGVLEPLRRKLLRDPLDLDLPHWIIDESFDLDFHVRHIGLAPPGAADQLAEHLIGHSDYARVLHCRMHPEHVLDLYGPEVRKPGRRTPR